MSNAPRVLKVLRRERFKFLVALVDKATDPATSGTDATKLAFIRGLFSNIKGEFITWYDSQSVVIRDIIKDVAIGVITDLKTGSTSEASSHQTEIDDYEVEV